MCCNCCGRNSDQNAKCHSAGSWGQRCALGLKTQRQLQSVALRRLALGLVLSSGSSKTPVSFSKPAFCFRNRRFVFETGVLLVAGWPNRRFAGCWLAKPALLLVAGCWLLVAGCWLLVVFGWFGRQFRHVWNSTFWLLFLPVQLQHISIFMVRFIIYYILLSSRIFQFKAWLDLLAWLVDWFAGSAC